MTKKVGRKPLTREAIKKRKELFIEYENLIKDAQSLLDSYRGTVLKQDNIHFITLLANIIEGATLRKFLLQRRMSTFMYNRAKRRGK